MKQRAGFVLPMAAVSIALLALGLALLSLGSDTLNREIRDLGEQVALETAAMTVEARVAHLMLTEPVDQRGLRVGGPRLLASGELGAPMEGPERSRAGVIVRPLVLDGRPYRDVVPSGRAVRILLQDEAGLVNLNAGDDPAVARLLQRIGVPYRRAEFMAGALGDDVDADSLRRLNGEEGASARNRPLEAPGAALRIPRWQGVLPLAAERRFINLSAAPADPARPFNLNTAPVDALVAVLGVEPRVAALIVRQRERRAFASATDVAEVAGVTIAGGATPVGGLPAREIRLFLSFFSESSTSRLPFFAYRSVIQVTADDADRPVLVRPASLLRGQTGDLRGREGDGDRGEFPLSPALLDRRRR